MLFSEKGLLLALLISPWIGLGAGAPADLNDRESPCTTFGECAGGDLQPSPAPTTAPPPHTPAPSPIFGCSYEADPDGGQGYCPAVGARGWCVCSDSSTYGIETGSNPCGYTAPPTSGPTTLASTDCTTSTPPAPSATSSSSGRTKCSQAECPKFCDRGNGAAKRSIGAEDGPFDLEKRFYENSNPDQFPYQLLDQSYTTNICPSKRLVNRYLWKNLENQRVNYAAALQGLCGCTTIIIASSKGVFSSHIWELDENNDPPRDLQPPNYQDTLQDLQGQLSPHQEDLAGGEAFLIIPTDPDGSSNPSNPDNYLYGKDIVDAITNTITQATGGLVPTITTYDPLDFQDSTELGTNRKGTASFEFDPAYNSNGASSRAYRIISEGTVLSLKTDL